MPFLQHVPLPPFLLLLLLLLLLSPLGALPTSDGAPTTSPSHAGAAGPQAASLTFSGNGCPQGSVVGATLDDALVFPGFAARMSDAASPAERSRNCQLHAGVAARPGWQFGVDRVRLSGYLVLEAGAAATVYTTAYFSQDAADTYTTQQSWTNDNELPITAFVSKTSSVSLWSPCSRGGILNLNSRVAFTASQRKPNGHVPYGYFGSYGIEASNFTYLVSEKVELKWRQCNGSEWRS